MLDYRNLHVKSQKVLIFFYHFKVLEEGDYNEEKVYTGEVARLKSYITQRPPFDVKNPYMSPIKINRNIHKVCIHLHLPRNRS